MGRQVKSQEEWLWQKQRQREGQQSWMKTVLWGAAWPIPAEETKPAGSLMGGVSLQCSTQEHDVLTIEGQREALDRGDQRKQHIIVDCGGRFLFDHGVG